MAYRFEGDKFCMAKRFAAYSEALGDRFIGRVLPEGAANTDLAPFFERYVASPHSVVTAHLIDEAGQPTIAARDEICSFFTLRLAPGRLRGCNFPARCRAHGGRPRLESEPARVTFLTRRARQEMSGYPSC